MLELTRTNRYGYKQKYLPLPVYSILSNKPPNTLFGEIQDMSIRPEDITFDNRITDKNYRISYDKIKLTSHAKQQAWIRLGIQSELEIKKLAARAKRNGLLINSLTKDNYETFKLTKEHYEWLWDKSGLQYNSCLGSVYFYQAHFYIFCGSKQRTLRTVVYPGQVIEATKPSTGNEVIDNFFNSFVDSRFHNIATKSGRKTKVVY